MRKQAWSRRQFLRLAGASSAATVLTACTLPPPPSAGGGRIASEAVQPAAEGLTLSHWQPYSAGQVAAVETFKTQFEDQNSGVTIEFQPISWGAYWEQLAAGIAAGAAPDIFQIPMGLAEEHIARGNIIPVSELVIASADIEENYLTWTVQRGKKGDDYYGLPVDVQTLVIYRQNALYEEAGLDPTTPYTDHGDLMQQALALTKKTNGKTDQIGCSTSYYSAWQTILFQQYLQREENGAMWVNEDTNQLVWQDYPAILETFNWFCTLSAEADDDAFLTFLSREEQFALGKIGMQIGHPVHRGILQRLIPELEYTIVPFPPRAAGQDLYTAGSHWMWVVGQWAADNAETAWNWVYFCTNREAQATWNEAAGDLPSFKDLNADEQFRPDDNAAVCMDSLNYATPWEWVGWVEWIKEFSDARDRVVNDGEDPEKSFATMVVNLNQIIAEHTA